MMELVFTYQGPGIKLPNNKIKLWNFQEVESTEVIPFTDNLLITLLEHIPSLKSYLIVVRGCEPCRYKLKKRIFLDWKDLQQELPENTLPTLLQKGGTLC